MCMSDAMSSSEQCPKKTLIGRGNSIGRQGRKTTFGIIVKISVMFRKATISIKSEK